MKPNKLFEVFTALFLAFILFGCSTTSEITKQTIETTTVKPIAVKPPEIKTEMRAEQIPPTPQTDKKDTSTNEQYTAKKIVDVKTDKGQVVKDTVTLNLKVKKDSKGHKYIDAIVGVNQDSLRTPAEVTNKKETTDSKSETKSIVAESTSLVKWLIVAAIIIGVLIFILKQQIISFFKK